MEENPDYVTLMACLNPQRAIVVLMTFDKPSDGYVHKRMSEALSLKAAHALADSWAAACHVEVR